MAAARQPKNNTNRSGTGRTVQVKSSRLLLASSRERAAATFNKSTKNNNSLN